MITKSKSDITASFKSKKKKNLHQNVSKSARVLPAHVHQTKNIRRRSSILNEIFDSDDPVLNRKSDPSQSMKQLMVQEDKINLCVSEILQTTQIYSGEGNGDVNRRNDIFERVANKYEKDEIVKILKDIVNKLDSKQLETNNNNRSTNSILFVGMISISDVISDLYCAYIYLNSGDNYLEQLGYNSLGILGFSLIFGTVMSWLLKAPCK